MKPRTAPQQQAEPPAGRGRATVDIEGQQVESDGLLGRLAYGQQPPAWLKDWSLRVFPLGLEPEQVDAWLRYAIGTTDPRKWKRLGLQIPDLDAGDTAADISAAPGGWTLLRHARKLAGLLKVPVGTEQPRSEEDCASALERIVEAVQEARSRAAPGTSAEEVASMMSLTGDHNAVAILQIATSSRSADERMRDIYKVDCRYLGWSSERWSQLLKTTSSAVRQTRWWKEDRKRLSS